MDYGEIYMCIDLKSFFASAECADRGLDPFTTNLVVADPARGNGAICLAITPAMKALGIRNRCRVFEIPPGVNYITALPRMRRYMEVSAEIYGVYLRYISPEDIHVYSIDECFIYATPYLNMYGMHPKQFAKMLMDAVFRQTDITATAGVGTNMFLAKIALDITAKHVPDHIGWLDEDSFKKRLWHHRPITDFWNIGPGIARRLEKYGVYDLCGVAAMDEQILYKEFGVNARFLIDHAHGRESCTIAEIHAYEPSGHSISNGQILFDDYNFDDALIVLKEMADNLSLELVEKKLAAESVSLMVGYSKDCRLPTGGTKRMTVCTNSHRKLAERLEQLYKETTHRNAPIRSLNIGFCGLTPEENSGFDLFMDPAAEEKEKNMQRAIIDIKQRFGKNSLIKAMSLQNRATGIRRNNMVGGHNGG